MAFLLPNFSPPLLSLPKPSTNRLPTVVSGAGAGELKLEPQRSPVLPALQQRAPPPAPAPPQKPSILFQKPPNDTKNKDDFYLNLGVAVRTLRKDLPSIFVRDPDYNIYRKDVTFIDPLNTFQGIENYKFMFWALRFHGRILFREIGLQIFRVWQPSENIILIRWELQGTPRLPWRAQGRFQGSFWYKLDRHGKIYEHKVDNLALNFPRAGIGSGSVMNLVTAATPSPNLTFGRHNSEDDSLRDSCAWLELYRAVRGSLEHKGSTHVGFGIEDFVACS